MGFRIGIDTGGTFTDLVAVDEATGNIVTAKRPSTPKDPIMSHREEWRECDIGHNQGI